MTAEPRRFRIDEDWAATIVGLLLIVLVLLKVIRLHLVAANWAWPTNCAPCWRPRSRSAA